MKLFGVKSLSSFFSVLCAIAIPVIILTGIAGIVFWGAVTFSDKASEFITAEMKKDADTTPKDIKDWEEFRKMHVSIKILMLPYGLVLVWLLILITRRSKQLFDNLKKDIVFNKANVELMRKINKVLLIFSIMTFNFSGLFTCILLLMLIEIFRSGTKLQEEHDLTV